MSGKATGKYKCTAAEMRDTRGLFRCVVDRQGTAATSAQRTQLVTQLHAGYQSEREIRMWGGMNIVRQLNCSISSREVASRKV